MPESVDEFIKSINSPIKKIMCGDLLLLGSQILQHIVGNDPAAATAPALKVIQDDTINAEGIDGLIIVTSGLIDYCLALAIPRLDDFNEIYIQFNSSPPLSICHSSFLWVLMHEYTHARRRHNFILENVTNNTLTRQTLEYDADLSATANIFRWSQYHLHDHISTQKIKRLVYYNIFWAIRNLAPPPKHSDHLPSATRLFHINAKLSSLREDPFASPDPSMISSECRESADDLSKLATELEISYAKREGFDVKQHLFEQLSIIESGEWSSVVRRWDDIRTTVSILSGTQT